jgi:hypothetical protein
MAITFGDTGAPSNITTYLDALFAQSLANRSKDVKDNIGSTNALMHKLIASGSYTAADGGSYIEEALMYGLAPSDSYDGYDELSTLPTDGVGAAQFEWRQQASPIVYNMADVLKNTNTGRLINMVKTKIQQAEMGIEEGWAQAFMFGNKPNGGAITDPRVSTVNASYNIEPLSKLIAYNSTTLTVGNIGESANTWWRNRSKTSAATTYAAFLLELTNMYNSCALGTGGAPDIILVDQTTYELFIAAYFAIYKTAPEASNEYPFEAKKFFKAAIVMDDKVPDVYSGAIPTLTGGAGDPSTLTYGSAYFINSKFFKIRYMPGRDFQMLSDDNGKTFAKPLNGDSRVGHLAWMGNVTISNRRKHGVIGKIARTLT